MYCLLLSFLRLSFLSAVISLTAGAAAYLLLLNRILLKFRDGTLKSIIVVFLAAVMPLGSAYWGYRTGLSSWMILPVLVLAGIAIGEAHRRHIRQRHRGTKPVEGRYVNTSLFRPLTVTDLNVLRYEVAVSKWRGERLRIAHISDLHVSAAYPDSFYDEIREHIIERQPDVLFITGDFVTKRESLHVLPGVLPRFASCCPAFAVLGNHDYWSGADEVVEIIRASGITFLTNDWRRVQLDTYREFWLCGYEHPWRDDRIPAAPPDALSIVLTHTPDNIYDLSEAGADLVFAGHFHAGQFRLPYLGSLVIPSAYGRRFDHGHFAVNGTQLFVTSGIGAADPPFRFYCQPDIFFVDIVAEVME